jgi:hypothetical protein
MKVTKISKPMFCLLLAILREEREVTDGIYAYTVYSVTAGYTEVLVLCEHHSQMVALHESATP